MRSFVPDIGEHNVTVAMLPGDLLITELDTLKVVMLLLACRLAP